MKTHRPSSTSPTLAFGAGSELLNPTDFSTLSLLASEEASDEFPPTPNTKYPPKLDILPSVYLSEKRWLV